MEDVTGLELMQCWTGRVGLLELPFYAANSRDNAVQRCYVVTQRSKKTNLSSLYESVRHVGRFAQKLSLAATNFLQILFRESENLRDRQKFAVFSMILFGYPTDAAKYIQISSRVYINSDWNYLAKRNRDGECMDGI